jgi:hypothetical protein
VALIDGDAAGGDGIDRIRVKIRYPGTGEVIYDNQMGGPDDAEPRKPPWRRIGGYP